MSSGLFRFVGSYWASSGSFDYVGFVMACPGRSRDHSTSLGSFGRDMGVVGFILFLGFIHAPWGSLGAFRIVHSGS